MSSFTGVLKQIADQMTNQANRPTTEWINNKGGFIQTIKQHSDELLNYTTAFVATAVAESGLLRSEEIHLQIENALVRLKEESAELLKKVREDSVAAIEEARKLAEEIESKARKTANKISVKEAQDQFQSAQEDLEKKARRWGWLSSASISVLLGTVVILLFVHPKYVEGDKWPVYETVIRVTLIGILAAVSAFCMRIYRAHIHMRELNLHRQRIANSIGSFVESALNADQRDTILTRLVEAICNFGNSGLLTENDDMATPSRTIIETVTKSVTSPTRQ